ncbi:MAG: hypothetical protein DESF_02551 [Desulfovibrio sp.]
MRRNERGKNLRICIRKVHQVWDWAEFCTGVKLIKPSPTGNGFIDLLDIEQFHLEIVLEKA